VLLSTRSAAVSARLRSSSVFFVSGRVSPSTRVNARSALRSVLSSVPRVFFSSVPISSTGILSNFARMLLICSSMFSIFPGTTEIGEASPPNRSSPSAHPENTRWRRIAAR